MSNIPFNWPKKGDDAFPQDLPSLDLSQLIAFVMPSDAAYCEGFQRAADMVVEAAQRDELNLNDLFFPVAYLYRHHLELKLKGLIEYGVQLGILECSNGSTLHHNLYQLWNQTKLLIKSICPNPPFEELDAVEIVIRQFHDLDRTGQALRYAWDKTGNAHLANAPARVDLTRLQRIMDGVSSFLDGVEAAIDYGDPGLP